MRNEKLDGWQGPVQLALNRMVAVYVFPHGPAVAPFL